MNDVTIPAEVAAHIAVILRGAESGRPVAEPAVMRHLADLLDPPPPSPEASDAEHLLDAERRLDTVSALVAVDPAMGVVVTEQIKTLLQVVAKSTRHGAASHPCECLVCASVHSLADTILRQADPPPSLRDELVDAAKDGIFRRHPPEDVADAVLAVVRRHVRESRGMCESCGSMHSLDRDEVLALLGGDQ